jgi:uncharacterized protein YcfJ
MTSNPNDDDEVTNSNHSVKNAIAIAAIGALLIGAAASLPISNLGFINGQHLAAAQQQQTEQQQNQTQSSNATTIANQTMTDTFRANGVITGTVQSQGGGGAGQQTSSAAGMSSSPFLVGGDWTIDVQSGNVTNFRANFTMERTDGSEHHSHDITSFKLGNITQFQLDPKGKSTINGTADYSVNGTSKWPGSDTTLTIEKARILSIQPDEQEAKDHFQGQPIYGIVLKATGGNGTTIVESVPAGGNQTQQPGGGLLENLTKPFEGLFGGGGK